MRCWSKGYRPLVIRQTSSGDLIYSKAIIVNNYILYLRVSKRDVLVVSHHTLTHKGVGSVC